jgi:hypothetical protein
MSNISNSILVAFERTNTLPRSIEGTVNDISTEFKDLDIQHIQKAIRRGSLGFYGKTYGEVSTQEICIWIIKYIEENPDAEPLEDKLNRLNREEVNG